VLLEIQKTFDFFKASATSDRIDRIVLSGGAARVDGFVQALTERFNTSVELFDPFKKITFEPAKLGVDDPDGAAPTAAVAVGLALRRGGDR
jgi:type IV pilus assembly protein PilM